MNAVRRDRKFFTSLRLHESILVHLEREPERVRSIGLSNIPKRRSHARGSAINMVEEWEILLLNRNFDRVRDYMTGEDESSCEMRNLSPFAGVISEAERRIALDLAYADVERTQDR